MSKLLKYSRKSSLMDIQIKFGSEVFKFNLYKEIQISLSAIEEELKTQPSAYGFLSMLHKKLIRFHDDKESLKKRVYAQIYLENKFKKNDETGRVNSDDAVKQMVELDEKHIKSVQELLDAKENMMMIESCVRSFEQRKDLLQSLNTNLRKENK